jgi:hypothetical protein
MSLPTQPATTILSQSSPVQKAWKDLETLGYDVPAFRRMNMSEDQVIELRDKAFRYWRMMIPEVETTAISENEKRKNLNN